MGNGKNGKSGTDCHSKGSQRKLWLSEGSRLVVLGDLEGIALIPTERFEQQLRNAMEQSRKIVEE